MNEPPDGWNWDKLLDEATELEPSEDLAEAMEHQALYWDFGFPDDKILTGLAEFFFSQVQAREWFGAERTYKRIMRRVRKLQKNFDSHRHLFKSNPHGEHTVFQTEPLQPDAVASALCVGNSLFNIQDTSGNRIGFTAEELTDLSRQWLAWKSRHYKPK